MGNENCWFKSWGCLRPFRVEFDLDLAVSTGFSLGSPASSNTLKAGMWGKLATCGGKYLGVLFTSEEKIESDY